jgi:ferric-dicitrate binding protein FerR (iron transport regulator)
MKGGSFSSACGTRRATASQRRRRSRRVVRRLRTNASGRYRTRGRYSAATVRGTRYTVEDRCDGTVTTVQRGSVTVRDFKRRRTVTVRQGKSYRAAP